MLQNAEVWVLIGFIAFFLAVRKPGWKAIAGGLDGRAAKIRAQIDEAAVLRREAETMLAAGEKRRTEALVEARQLRETAGIEAKRLVAESAEALKLLSERRQKAAQDKIAEAEAAALAEVRRAAVAAAIVATRAILEARVPGAIGDRLIDQAIDELPATLNQAA